LDDNKLSKKRRWQYSAEVRQKICMYGRTKKRRRKSSLLDKTGLVEKVTGEKSSINAGGECGRKRAAGDGGSIRPRRGRRREEERMSG